MSGHMWQKTTKFWLHSPPMSLETYSFLYLLHISVSAIKGHHHHFHLCSKLVKSVFHFDLSIQSKEEDDLETMTNKQVENQSYHSCCRFSFKISLTFNKKNWSTKFLHRCRRHPLMRKRSQPSQALNDKSFSIKFMVNRKINVSWQT